MGPIVPAHMPSCAELSALNTGPQPDLLARLADRIDLITLAGDTTPRKS
jgi:hypothetical protein